MAKSGAVSQTRNLPAKTPPRDAAGNALLSVLAPGLGQFAQRRYFTGAGQLTTAVAYSVAAFALGSGSALWLALGWNVWSAIDAYRHARSHPAIAKLIVVVTGASGAGKTAAVEALEKRGLPGVRCFHFDSIGVPAGEVLDREYGGSEAWQTWATNEWFARLSALGDDVRIAVLDAQTHPSNVVNAAGAGGDWTAHIVLFDCRDDVRNQRLRDGRGQPELATDRMNNWAAHLREQASVLNLPVIDTSRLTVTEAADQLEALLRRLVLEL